MKAMESLRKRDDIIIKPADKGGAVVVWKRALYIEEALRQLNSPVHYQKLAKPALPDNQKSITKAIKEFIARGQLPPTAKLLIKTLPRESLFYLLPKIHKANNPGRPIVSACSCPTEHISEYLDTLLQPLVQQLPSFVKDSTHALQLIQNLNETPDFCPTYLFTLDVTSLYTIIPHVDGLRALQYFLDTREKPTPSTATLVRLAELVLNNNTFSFQGETFRQMSGVAMGTKMGPSYACLFMGYQELRIQQEYKGPVPEFYKRYIDDGLGATSMPLSDLQTFISFVQSFHPSVKFTFEISETKVTFLDMLIQINETGLSTSVHYKPTDSHSYLDHRSSHPPNTKNSIPFSQFLRLRRLCSDPVDFVEKAEEMKRFFLRRNYPQTVVDEACKKVRLLPRQKCLQPKVDTETESRPVATLLYHPSVHQIRKILLSNCDILQSRNEVAKIFKDPPLIAYKRDTNIRDRLVHSKLPGATKRPPGTTPCDRPNCKICPFISTSTDVTGPRSQMRVTKYFNCITYNLIYVIHCTQCSKIYIGETGRTLETRFKEHLADIKHNRDKPVANHFNSPNHSVHHARVKGLWLMKTSNPKDRKDMESHLIEKLGSRNPLGLNEKA